MCVSLLCYYFLQCCRCFLRHSHGKSHYLFLITVNEYLQLLNVSTLLFIVTSRPIVFKHVITFGFWMMWCADGRYISQWSAVHPPAPAATQTGRTFCWNQSTAPTDTSVRGEKGKLYPFDLSMFISVDSFFSIFVFLMFHEDVKDVWRWIIPIWQCF